MQMHLTPVSQLFCSSSSCGISLYDFAECVDLFAGEKGAKEKGGME